MSYNLLPGKTVIITGAATGIGRATAIAAARNGANVVIHHLGAPTDAEAISLQEELTKLGAKSLVVEGDISDPATSAMIVNETVKAFGRIDALVSNAGICVFANFLEITPELWRRHHAINLEGAFHITQAVGRQMSQQDEIDGERGSIVALSSISAVRGGEMQCHYCPTKAGIKSLMESCAIALGKYKIRCNSVMPGTIVTQLNSEQLAVKEVLDVQEAKIPSGRVGLPDDVAGPIIFMLSPLARYVNGAGLLVDGGWAINIQ